MTTYLPSAEGWASQRAGWGTSQAGNGRLRIKVERSYDSAANRSTLTFTLEGCSSVYSGTFGLVDGGTLSVNGATVQTFGASPRHYLRTYKDAAWRAVYTGGGSDTASWTQTVQHAADGTGSVSVAVSFTASYTVGGTSYTMLWDNSAALSFSEPRGSSIASLSASVETLASISLSMNRASAAFYHKASFLRGSTVLAVSDAFAASLSYPAPRSWFDAVTDAASQSVTVRVQTYTDSGCLTPIGDPASGTVTVTADAGMAPEPGALFAAAAACNDGTAAAGVSGYVEGYSKARLTLTKSALTLHNNAAVASYRVSCQGTETTIAAPGAVETADTATLTGSEPVTVTVTVTDSRGFTASTSLTVTPMAYAPPAITDVAVFRCAAGGAENADGAYVSVKAAGFFSSLGGQNSLTLTAQLQQGGGSYGAASALTSGTARVLGGALDPDQRLNVRLTATDALGNAASALRSLPTRVWAMKLRPDGRGVAFGKAPEYGDALELPADWDLKFGARSFLDLVYPVGAIYLSVNSTSPAVLFGGTWERVKDVFLLAAGNTYAAGSTGGEEEHVLSVDEIPAHAHRTKINDGATIGYIAGNYTYIAQNIDGALSGSAGGGAAHNNMPPYLAVYVWKRTA